jgi:DNA repair exonuclease SbcCD nuclease subunit
MSLNRPRRARYQTLLFSDLFGFPPAACGRGLAGGMRAGRIGLSYGHLLSCSTVPLAGDINSGTSGIEWALRSFRIPTVMIAGNHKFYRGDELYDHKSLSSVIGKSRTRLPVAL